MRRVVDVAFVLGKLSENFVYDVSVGCFHHRKTSGRARKGDRAGYQHSDGYRYISLTGKSYPEHYLVWLLETGSMPPRGQVLDHKNRIKHDNRFKNLRVATNAQNNVNSAARKDNKLSLKGVYFNKSHQKFHAVVWKDRKSHSCGYFVSGEDASKAAQAKRQELYGVFA